MLSQFTEAAVACAYKTWDSLRLRPVRGRAARCGWFRAAGVARRLVAALFGVFERLASERMASFMDLSCVFSSDRFGSRGTPEARSSRAGWWEGVQEPGWM